MNIQELVGDFVSSMENNLLGDNPNGDVLSTSKSNFYGHVISSYVKTINTYNEEIKNIKHNSLPSTADYEHLLRFLDSDSVSGALASPSQGSVWIGFNYYSLFDAAQYDSVSGNRKVILNKNTKIKFGENYPEFIFFYDIEIIFTVDDDQSTRENTFYARKINVIDDDGNDLERSFDPLGNIEVIDSTRRTFSGVSFLFVNIPIFNMEIESTFRSFSDTVNEVLIPYQNNLIGFDVYYKEPGEDKIRLNGKDRYIINPDGYNYTIRDGSITLYFNQNTNNSFEAKPISELYVDVYTTLGTEGNISITGARPEDFTLDPIFDPENEFQTTSTLKPSILLDTPNQTIQTRGGRDQLDEDSLRNIIVRNEEGQQIVSKNSLLRNSAEYGFTVEEERSDVLRTFRLSSPLRIENLLLPTVNVEVKINDKFLVLPNNPSDNSFTITPKDLFVRKIEPNRETINNFFQFVKEGSDYNVDNLGLPYNFRNEEGAEETHDEFSSPFYLRIDSGGAVTHNIFKIFKNEEIYPRNSYFDNTTDIELRVSKVVLAFNPLQTKDGDVNNEDDNGLRGIEGIEQTDIGGTYTGDEGIATNAFAIDVFVDSSINENIIDVDTYKSKVKCGLKIEELSDNAPIFFSAQDPIVEKSGEEFRFRFLLFTDEYLSNSEIIILNLGSISQTDNTVINVSKTLLKDIKVSVCLFSSGATYSRTSGVDVNDVRDDADVYDAYIKKVKKEDEYFEDIARLNDYIMDTGEITANNYYLVSAYTFETTLIEEETSFKPPLDLNIISVPTTYENDQYATYESNVYKFEGGHLVDENGYYINSNGDLVNPRDANGNIIEDEDDRIVITRAAENPVLVPAILHRRGDIILEPKSGTPVYLTDDDGDPTDVSSPVFIADSNGNPTYLAEDDGNPPVYLTNDNDDPYYLADVSGNPLFETKNDSDGNTIYLRFYTDNNDNVFIIYETRDSDGNPTYKIRNNEGNLIEVTTNTGDAAYLTYSNGNPVYKEDENGNVVLMRDVEGNLATDTNGNLVPERVRATCTVKSMTRRIRHRRGTSIVDSRGNVVTTTNTVYKLDNMSLIDKNIMTAGNYERIINLLNIMSSNFKNINDRIFGGNIDLSLNLTSSHDIETFKYIDLTSPDISHVDARKVIDSDLKIEVKVKILVRYIDNEVIKNQIERDLYDSFVDVVIGKNEITAFEIADALKDSNNSIISLFIEKINDKPIDELQKIYKTDPSNPITLSVKLKRNVDGFIPDVTVNFFS